MATKTKAAPWEAKEAELEEVTHRRTALAGRAERLRVVLAQLPQRADRARRSALEAGQGSWEAIKPLHEERQEIEAELVSIQADEEDLAVRARDLATTIGMIRAKDLDVQAEKIRNEQRDRLTEVGALVQKLTDAYGDIVRGERALADLRALIAEALGRQGHGLAKPVVEPLAQTPGLWLDQIAWVATTPVARGTTFGMRKQSPLVNDLWLTSVPDLCDRDGAPTLAIDGLRPYMFRILQRM